MQEFGSNLDVSNHSSESAEVVDALMKEYCCKWPLDKSGNS